MNSDIVLANLNQSQLAAVTSIANTLAILAGPGSGKTHTLTSRTAWLLGQGLQPWNIIVATFTVKAAREMKERIGKLIGNGMESKLILGTFHSIARRYLARYGHLIGIKKDFGIADSGDSIAIIKRIVKRNDFLIDPKVARSRISGCKARGAEYTDDTKKATTKSVEAQEFEQVYTEYEEALKRSNMLDYDDLLLRCVELLRDHPSCVSNVEAVLIDEFQDTNIVQFDLMRLFAAKQKQKRITIVGDPDQSIYGFRAAEIRNYKRLLHQYPDTVTIALEENYRSSGAILLGALTVIKQDTSRVDKSLLPTHSVGTRPVLRKLSNAYNEAQWIVSEVKRCIGLTGDLLDLNDFAILVRSASLSRLIESALGKSGIAYRMVGGLRFYDRVEVKTVLDYLRVINQPDNNDAVARIINTPSRRIGEATVKALLEEAETRKMSLWQLILDSVQGRRAIKTLIKKNVENGLSEFVNIILTGMKKNSGPPTERLPINGVINHILDKTDYENWLKAHHDDKHGARWENVQELVTQATDFQDMITSGYEDEALPEIDGLNQQDDDDYLSKFLANVALASEIKPEEADGVASLAQVTISTIHAAKGLEWPVVFIPATYQGSIPHSRAEDADEERRLLYVAMTRAKVLLYLSYPLKNSQSEATVLSPFLTSQSITRNLDIRGPSLQSLTVQSMSQILRRACPSPLSIVESSKNLDNIEDDQFPTDGEGQQQDRDLKWSLTQGSQTFSMGQEGPKRRRVELGRSSSDFKEASGGKWKPSYVTTMAHSSDFTTSGFVTAGSHLEGLKDKYAKSYEFKIDNHDMDMNKQKSTGKSKISEGQGTLHTFLGKTKPQNQAPQRTVSTNEPLHGRQGLPRGLAAGYSNINKPRVSSLDGATQAIEPSLASHRLKPTIGSIKPRSSTKGEEDRPHNEYVFLSSSPPHARLPHAAAQERRLASIPEKTVNGVMQKPTLLPLIRPAASMHTTSLDILRVEGPKKALGVRRSVNAGWGSQKGVKFRPPSMKRPIGDL